MFWVSFGHVLSIIQTWFGYHSDMFRVSSRHVLGIIWACFRHDLDMFRAWFGHVSDIIWACFGHDLDMFRASSRHVWHAFFNILTYFFSKFEISFFSKIWKINQKAPTVPPRVITPTRPAPAGPDGGVRGGGAPREHYPANTPKYTKNNQKIQKTIKINFSSTVQLEISWLTRIWKPKYWVI